MKPMTLSLSDALVGVAVSEFAETVGFGSDVGNLSTNSSFLGVTLAERLEKKAENLRRSFGVALLLAPLPSGSSVSKRSGVFRASSSSSSPSALSPFSLLMNSSSDCEVRKSGSDEQTSGPLSSPPPLPLPMMPLSLIFDSDTEWLMVIVDASEDRDRSRCDPSRHALSSS